MGEPQKASGVWATPHKEVKTRKNLRDYLIQTPVGQMGALRPGVGGLLWEHSQRWLLLPLLLQIAVAPVAMGTSLAPRVSAAPPPPPSFPSNRPPPPALILACLATQLCPQTPHSHLPHPQFQPDPHSGGSESKPGSFDFWWQRDQPLLPLSVFKFRTSPHFSSLTVQYMTTDWVRGGQRELQ